MTVKQLCMLIAVLFLNTEYAKALTAAESNQLLQCQTTVQALQQQINNLKAQPAGVVTQAAAVASGGFNCQVNNKLTSAIRQQIVNKVNELRSTLAQGNAQALNGKAPAGSNIHKLTYDCEIEAKAQQYVDKCVYAHDASIRGVYSENLYGAWGGSADPEQRILSAINSWWGELKNNYTITDKTMTFTRAVANLGVGHFTALAWATSKKIGCGFINGCTGNPPLIIACRLAPSGNMLTGSIYVPGPPCSKCPAGCNSSTGLCE